MYSYEGDFLLLDDVNDMLPKKNLFITLVLCFIFYNIVIIDIYLAEKIYLFKILQLILIIVNFISISALLCRDPGKATNISGSSKNAINFIDDNVINTAKIQSYRLLNRYDDDFCEKCSVIQKNMISHCKYCDICFINRDHHCAWFNRCIANNNLKPFRNFLISSALSALIIVLDSIFIFSGKYFFKLTLLEIMSILTVLMISMLLFVLTGLLTLQYGIAALLDVQTRKLITGDWNWKSTRLFRLLKRKNLVRVDEFESD